MATLTGLLDIAGVVSAWRWEPGSTQPGASQGPRLVEFSGDMTAEIAELGMRYVETLGNFMFFQCSVLDHRLKRQAFLPAHSIMVEAKEMTMVATENRVAVFVDNYKRPNFWTLERQMLQVENSY
jgi:roadblock/LC7 domain-containing protein